MLLFKAHPWINLTNAHGPREGLSFGTRLYFGRESGPFSMQWDITHNECSSWIRLTIDTSDSKRRPHAGPIHTQLYPQNFVSSRAIPPCFPPIILPLQSTQQPLTSTASGPDSRFEFPSKPCPQAAPQCKAACEMLPKIQGPSTGRPM